MSSKISDLEVQDPTIVTDLYFAGVDLSNPEAPADRRTSVPQMLAAYMAANDYAKTGAGGTFTASKLGITVPAGGFVDSLLYTPNAVANDIAMVALQFGQAGIIPQAFGFQLYAGAPTSGNPVLLYDSVVATGTSIKTAKATMQSTLYLPAALGTNALYIRAINLGSGSLTYGFQGVFLEFPGSGIVLPAYVTPPPYLGPLLSTVHVGANEQFAEPQYAMQALADGGTMFVDDGHYYLPFGLLNTASADAPTRPNYGSTTANPGNRFTGGVSIIGNSTYGTVFDGLGGIGNGFRLTQGKGFVYTQVSLTLKNVQIISAGGADKTGDGEAGFYAEDFMAAGTATLQNVAFDNNENGIVIPDVDGVSSTTGLLVPGSNNGPGCNVSLALTCCDFGLQAGNGVTPDGLSHNFYCEGKSNSVSSCHLFSAAVGNTIKNRGPLITVSGGYAEAGAGRLLDMPEGGSCTMTGVAMMVIPGANQSFLGYIDEQRGSRHGEYNPQFTGCTLTGTRAGPSGSALWYGAADQAGQFVFSNCAQFWYPLGGGTPTFLPQYEQSQGELDTGAASGLFLTPAQGGTVLTARPTRPGSIAQPGYVPAALTAWNGTVTNVWS